MIKTYFFSNVVDTFPGYMQDKGAAFATELIHFNQGKRACVKKDGQGATTLASHPPTNRAVCPKSADHKRLNMDGNITDNRRKPGVKRCIRNRQKNNSVDSKGMCHKLHIEDDTFENSTKRYPLGLVFYFGSSINMSYISSLVIRLCCFSNCRLFTILDVQHLHIVVSF